jgi:L-lactate dehydrogenase complex protein LldE
MPEARPTVALFVTCLVDLMRPSVGFAAVKLLEEAGCDVVVPSAQTCCGQPAYNSGDSKNAKSVARRVIEAFAGFDYVVLPSGSCGGTIRVHYPEMFEGEPVWRDRARDLARRTYELTTFLAEVRKTGPIQGELPAVTAYHDSCSGLRELKIRTQPRELLAGIRGLEVREMADADACCGFGGLFCVKYPEVSEKMVDVKVDAILASGAGMLLGGDMGCLMNMAGRLQRRGSRVEVRHVAEVLAGTTVDTPAIGEAEASPLARREPA